jgi:hypothetical protein
MVVVSFRRFRESNVSIRSSGYVLKENKTKVLIDDSIFKVKRKLGYTQEILSF